jgi:hypothetical protein
MEREFSSKHFTYCKYQLAKREAELSGAAAM